MLFRQMTKYSAAACNRCDLVLNFMSSKAAKSQVVVSSSATFALDPPQKGNRATHTSASHNVPFRVEGVQGPITTPLTLKESRQLLESAAKEASAGFSQQGVQGCYLHTGQSNHTQAAGQAAVEWQMEDRACPQGVQGFMETDDDPQCGYFFTWLNNCRRYGLADCDQQLEGIQSGRLSLAQVLAEQEARIAEIADSYHKRSQEHPTVHAQDESFQGAQDDLQLPDIDMPCPQGVQGDDCVRFKLWLENCHRFGIHECLQQLQGFQSGRITLAEIFEEQDAIIREVVQKYQRKRN